MEIAEEIAGVNRPLYKPDGEYPQLSCAIL
jgi:hypothetical protein